MVMISFTYYVGSYISGGWEGDASQLSWCTKKDQEAMWQDDRRLGSALANSTPTVIKQRRLAIDECEKPPSKRFHHVRGFKKEELVSVTKVYLNFNLREWRGVYLSGRYILAISEIDNRPLCWSISLMVTPWQLLLPSYDDFTESSNFIFITGTTSSSTSLHPFNHFTTHSFYCNAHIQTFIQGFISISLLVCLSLHLPIYHVCTQLSIYLLFFFQTHII